MRSPFARTSTPRGWVTLIALDTGAVYGRLHDLLNLYVVLGGCVIVAVVITASSKPSEDRVEPASLRDGLSRVWVPLAAFGAGVFYADADVTLWIAALTTGIVLTVLELWMCRR